MFRRHQIRIMKNQKNSFLIKPVLKDNRIKKGLFKKIFLNSPVDYIIILLYNEKGYFYEN